MHSFRDELLTNNDPLLGKISVAEILSNVAILSILENPQFCKVKVVVAIVIVINSVIGGFSWVHLIWLANVIVWLQATVWLNSQLSDYNHTQ